ncbi:MAG: hypothetical protein ACI4TW_06895 [Prevotella sp.]
MAGIRSLLTDDRKAKCLFAAIWIILAVTAVLHSVIYNMEVCHYRSWGISDWLINYEGGFVRRGLTGQILLELYRIHPYDVRMTIVLVTVVSSLWLLLIVCRMFHRKGWSYAILPLGCCFYYGFMELWVRKDMLLLLLAYFIFSSYRKYSSRHDTFHLSLFVVLSSVILLIHEAAFFFTVPILITYGIAAGRKERGSMGFSALARLLLPFLPAVLTMAAVCLFKGNSTMPDVIWRSWHEVFRAYPDGTSSLPDLYNNVGQGVVSLSWTTLDTMRLHLNVNFFGYFPGNRYIILSASILLWVWMFLGYYFIVSRLNTMSFRKGATALHTEQEIGNTLLIQFLFMLPMFTFLSCDFGRTIPYWVLSSLMAVGCLGKLDIPVPDNLTERMQKPFGSLPIGSKFTYCLMVISVPMVDNYSPLGCLQFRIIGKIAALLVG